MAVLAAHHTDSRRWGSTKQAFNAEILINSRPVNAKASPGNFPVITILLRTSSVELTCITRALGLTMKLFPCFYDLNSSVCLMEHGPMNSAIIAATIRLCCARQPEDSKHSHRERAGSSASKPIL